MIITKPVIVPQTKDTFKVLINIFQQDFSTSLRKSVNTVKKHMLCGLSYSFLVTSIGQFVKLSGLHSQKQNKTLNEQYQWQFKQTFNLLTRKDPQQPQIISVQYSLHVKTLHSYFIWTSVSSDNSLWKVGTTFVC